MNVKKSRLKLRGFLYLDYHDVIDCKTIEKKALLECGEGSGSMTFTSISDNQPFQIARVSIDTKGLCQPIVNIEFSSSFKFEVVQEESAVGSFRLQYELFSSCNGETPLSRGVWILQKIVNIGTNLTRSETTSFGFNFCESLTCCSGNIEYFVVVKPIDISSDFGNVEVIGTVSNGRMAALAQESC